MVAFHFIRFRPNKWWPLIPALLLTAVALDDEALAPMSRANELWIDTVLEGMKKLKSDPTCACQTWVVCLPEKKLVLGLGDSLSVWGGAVDPNERFGLEKESTV